MYKVQVYVTHSNTLGSFWSPQITVSAIERRTSTINVLLLSVTIEFFTSTEYRDLVYFNSDQCTVNGMVRCKIVIYIYNVKIVWVSEYGKKRWMTCITHLSKSREGGLFCLTTVPNHDLLIIQCHFFIPPKTISLFINLVSC